LKRNSKGLHNTLWKLCAFDRCCRKRHNFTSQ